MAVKEELNKKVHISLYRRRLLLLLFLEETEEELHSVCVQLSKNFPENFQL